MSTRQRIKQKQKNKKGIIIMFSTLVIIAVLIINSYIDREVIIVLNPIYNDLLTPEQLKTKGHLYKIPEYSSTSTEGYYNKNGTITLYCYANPTHYIDTLGRLIKIDTRIANNKDKELRKKGYIYTIADSDIKTYYPNKITNDIGILFKNNEYFFEVGQNFKKCHARLVSKKNFIEIKKDMIKYGNISKGINMYLYPSHLGSNCELEFTNNPKSNILNMKIKIMKNSNLQLNITPGGYLVMELQGNIVGIIQKPLLKDIKGNISYNNKLSLYSEGDGIYNLVITLDNNRLAKGSIAFISFEMYRENQPDNTIYSKLPDITNCYKSNYSVIGNSSEYGLGRLFIRFGLTKIGGLKSSYISEAYYNTYSLSYKKDKLEMVTVLDDWCSITGNWSKNYSIGNQVQQLEVNQNQISFRITDEVKKWCDDDSGYLEHCGLMLKSIIEDENIYNIILSNDNTLYRVNTELILKTQ